jgi:hypothetical protein
MTPFAFSLFDSFIERYPVLTGKIDWALTTRFGNVS